MPDVEPDKWYFCAICSNCGESIPFEQAPSPEENPHPLHRRVQVDCPHCRTNATYDGSAIVRQQGPNSK